MWFIPKNEPSLLRVAAQGQLNICEGGVSGAGLTKEMTVTWRQPNNNETNQNIPGRAADLASLCHLTRDRRRRHPSQIIARMLSRALPIGRCDTESAESRYNLKDTSYGLAWVVCSVGLKDCKLKIYSLSVCVRVFFFLAARQCSTRKEEANINIKVKTMNYWLSECLLRGGNI